jgi:hypothetical protein
MHGGVEVQLHAFLDLTLDVSGQLHTLATSATGKEPPVPIRYKVGWVVMLWRRPSCPSSSTVQPVANHYTDWAILASKIFTYSNNYTYFQVQNTKCKYNDNYANFERWNGKGALLATCFHASFLLDLFFDPEDGGDMFLWKVGWLSMDYTALHPRWQNSS